MSITNEVKTDKTIQSYVIVGGGTAGWISAAILSQALRKQAHSITLVESPDIPTIGVGEATIPSFVDMLEYLQIPLPEFIAGTQATFKLGIKFSDWKTKNHHYWHQFGEVGNKVDGVSFYQHWLKHARKYNKYDYTDFSPSVALAKQNKFFIPSAKQPTNLSKSTFALHFDAIKLAQFLIDYCKQNEVRHVLENVSSIQTSKDGNIEAVMTDKGSLINGDFFIDCTGQKALLMEKTLRVGYRNWQHFLPVNRAVVAQSESISPLPPYTESIAHEHGWRWRIPLQNRTGNGYIYSSDYCSDDEAVKLLNSHVKDMITTPRFLKFTTGVRDKIWAKNCLAVGLSGGFLEPLESTSIYLTMRTMLNFVQTLPATSIHKPTVDDFNRKIINEYKYIRDFIVLHYCTSSRNDSPFWKMWQHNEIPSTLEAKLDLFSSQGRLLDNHYDLFSHESWYAVLEGMGVRPNSFDPLVNNSDAAMVSTALERSAGALIKSAGECLDHQEYLNKMLVGR